MCRGCCGQVVWGAADHKEAAAWAEQMGEHLREHLGRSPPAAAASPVPGALGALVACIFLGSLMAFLQLLLQNAVRGRPRPRPPSRPLPSALPRRITALLCASER